MPRHFELIETKVAPAGGWGGVSFSSIPQTYMDLQIVGSCRSTINGAIGVMRLYPNGNTPSQVSNTIARNVNNSYNSGRESNGTAGYVGVIPGATQNAAVFGSFTIDIPNYKSTSSKQLISNCVPEGSSATIDNAVDVCAILFRTTTAIDTLTFYTDGANITEGSVISLYGIKNT